MHRKKFHLLNTQFCKSTCFLSILFPSLQFCLQSKTGPCALARILFCPVHRPYHFSFLTFSFTITHLYLNMLSYLSSWKKPKPRDPNSFNPAFLFVCLLLKLFYPIHSFKMFSLFGTVCLGVTFFFLGLLVFPFWENSCLINSGHSCSHYILKYCFSLFLFFSNFW